MQVYQLFEPAEPTATVEPRQRNVLIVDDDALVRETLQFVLEDNGYTVHATASGADALQILERAATASMSCSFLDSNVVVRCMCTAASRSWVAG
jgi:CheY-like chemotaxis protein